ncbi:hypothetical protein BCIN_12g05450 [Botrytis cinerea B05.10]|uniref:Uncharacterized protein n=1 Tax=Botryotinia fuckeliana (strain B05.10) TaxID=332648 RepID=A0A384JZK5_BOTFB|nr:hypothetical protein BCIN_12g05450 [Botrytis cinerea B05.10]ATZ56005.1 hypothetical protein BCIN_12g05450 [Botrytis cinerea B05.10]
MDGFSKSQTAGQLMLQRISQNDNTQPDYPAQSIFHKPESREEYDWHTEINRGQVESAFHTLQHIRKITKSNFRLYWIGIQVRHFAKSDGTLGQTFGDSDGLYSYAMNTKHGIIIATESNSPYMIKRSKGKTAGEPVNEISTTTLQTWSDITYLSWHQQSTQSSTPLKNLKHIIQTHITNGKTISVIEYILEKEKIMFPQNGLIIDINDSKGYGAALLGTPNGKGTGWLLAQHKDQLGNPKIVSVEIFKSLKVRFFDCYEDTGELITGREYMRDDDDHQEFLNLDFTVRCG